MYCVEPAFSVPSTAYVTLICAMTLVPKRRAVLVDVPLNLVLQDFFFLKKTHHDLPDLRVLKQPNNNSHLYWTWLPVHGGRFPFKPFKPFGGTFKEGTLRNTSFWTVFAGHCLGNFHKRSQYVRIVM